MGLSAIVAQDVVTAALIDIRVARAGDVINPEDLAFGMSKLNRLLDRWNADPRARFNYGFAAYALTPNHQPHTIGPTNADFTVTARPATIRAANLILTDVSPVVRRPIDLIDDEQWATIAVQGITSTIPTMLYYSPDWPVASGNGSIYLWPVPTTAYQLEILTAGLFAFLEAQDTFWMPFGYLDALTLTLSEELAPGFGQTVGSSMADSARSGRDLIFGNNDDVPRLHTADAGIGSSSGSSSAFNWLDRSVS
jgi:hypothetical protein